MTIFCDQTQHVILKFVGVFPAGVNRLHDAIEELNGESPFKESERKKVELLTSKFSHEHGSYAVEVKVPYHVWKDKSGGEEKVQQFVMVKLFDALGEFRLA